MMSGEIVDAYPLTPLQKGMLYEVLANPDANLFIGSATFEFNGELEVPRFRAAWQAAIKLFPVLRTQFVWDGVKEPLQVVRDDCEIEIELVDCYGVSTEDRNDHTVQLRQEYRYKRIEIDQCPLMFLKLLRWSDNEHTLLWQVHHLVMDAWSASIVFKSVLNLYQEISRLPELQEKQLLSFSDYVQHVNSHDVDESKLYWKQYLESVDKSDLNVRTPLDQYAGMSYKAAGESVGSLGGPKQVIHSINERVWGQKKSSAVKEYCSENSITLAGLIHGVWAILISAYSNTRAPYFGSVVSGRFSSVQGVDRAVGLFINTLPFYTHLDSKLTIVEWIEVIQTQLQTNQKYGQVGLQDIKQYLSIGPESSVFDTVVTIEPELVGDDINSTDSVLRLKNTQFAVDSDVPLSLIFDSNKQFKVEFSFNPTIIHHSIVEQMQEDFDFVVDAFISGPNITSEEILARLQNKYQIGIKQPLFTSAERLSGSDGYTGVPSWFRQTARDYSNAVAIQNTQSAIDYKRFAAIVDKIAYQLRNVIVQGSVASDTAGDGLAGDSTLVGVCVTSVWKQIVSFFGVLDAQLAYVPLDPTISDERLAKILNNSSCRFVVSDNTLASRFDSLDVATLNIDDILDVKVANTEHASAGELAETQGAPELHGKDFGASGVEKTAYVMYTSGSTGEPKGVMVSHANLLYSTQARISYYQDSQPCFMLLSPTVFDSSVVGIYWALLGGGSLIAPESDEVKDVQLISKLIEQHGVDTILCLPTYYRLLLEGAKPEQLISLKRVILAGETCSGAIVELHHRTIPNAELFNEYGPTECTVWSSVARLEPNQSQVTIGDAIPGTSINIVDEHGYPVPMGTLGEIVVSGPGVARGYLFDDLETSKRFHSSLPAFENVSANKSYRTGDLGSFTTEQQLLFHGRIDRQIKIRGHRIEPAEIESAALNIPRVGKCVAIGVQSARLNDDGEGSLKKPTQMVSDALFDQISVYVMTASVSSNSEEDNVAVIDPMLLCEEVLDSIESNLPAYMHPAQVIVIDKFPKTATEKIDIAGLQSCEILAQVSKAKDQTKNSVASLSELEEPIQNILNQLELVAREVLQVSKIHPDDTFYELGGDSISAIMFVSRAREKGLDCDIKQLAAQKSFSVIATELAEIEKCSKDANESVRHHGPTSLTTIQRWYFSLKNPNPAHWSIAYRISLDHASKISLLSNSVTKTLNRFPAIGSRFTKDSTGWHCDIPESCSGLELINTISTDAAANQQLDSVLKQLAESWKLDKGWMIGFVFVEHEPALTTEFYLVVHHLVLDHIAISLLIRHICGDAGYHRDSDRAVAKEPMSLRQYASISSEAQCTVDSSQWASLADGMSSNPRPFSTEAQSDYTIISLSEQDTREVVLASEAANVNLLEVLVTVLSIVWNRRVNSQAASGLDLYIEASGRELPLDEQDVSDVVGWMTLFYPVDKSLINPSDSSETLKSVKNSLRLHKETHYQYLNWYFQQHKGCPTQGAINATCLINYLGESSSLMEADGYSINVCKKRFLRDKNANRPFDIELNAYSSNNQLHLDWYVGENTSSNFIEDLSRELIDEMISLANQLRTSGGRPLYTPSDFSSASLSQDDLDSILRDID